MKLHHALAVIASVVVLAACNDGGNETWTPPADANEVPASAVASISSFISYLSGLMNSETAEPLAINNITPPTSESAEPSTL